LITETQAFNHLAITNQGAMALHSRVSAKAISSVYFEVDQIAVNRFVFCPQVRRFWIATPFDARRRSVDQLFVQPFHYDLLVISGIGPIALCIGWLCFRA